MAVQVLNPDGIFKPDSYFQASISTGSRIICLSGQVALDKSGNLIGPGDLAKQTEQVYRNLFHALKALGATFADVAKLTAYVPNWAAEKMESLISGSTRAAQDLGFDPRRPITLVGISSLAGPELLIEVEALAVLP